MDTDPTPSSANSPPPLDRPYHTKRPHKKSRAGCKDCKTRKVKCDEARPSCRNCVLRRAACVYPSGSEHASTPNAGTAGRPDRQNRARSPPVVIKIEDDGPSEGINPIGSDGSLALVSEPLYHPASVEVSDMKLLWFYSTYTYSSFSAEGARHGMLDDILRVRIPQEAFVHPFLMDTLLALSALQMQSMGQGGDAVHARRALDLRARSFEGYRRAVEAGRPETLAALLANSLLLTALSSQMFREPGTKSLYIIDWMVVWRGIGLIVDMAAPEQLAASGMLGLFLRPTIDLDGSTKHIPNYLLFRISSIGIEDPEYEHKATYYEALKNLGSLYEELQQGINPMLGLRVVVWFTMLSKEFVGLARLKKPLALVIIAHYCCFNMFIQALWWQRDVGRVSIRQILDHCGSQYSELLRVPRAALGLQDHQYIELARLLLDDRTWTPADYYGRPELHQGPKVLKFMSIDGDEVALPSTPAESTSIWRLSPSPSWKIEQSPADLGLIPQVEDPPNIDLQVDRPHTWFAPNPRSVSEYSP